MDFTSTREMEGVATSGIWRSDGEGDKFDLVYPINEWKYIIEGKFHMIQDGKDVIATKGDAVYLPKVNRSCSQR